MKIHVLVAAEAGEGVDVYAGWTWKACVDDFVDDYHLNYDDVRELRQLKPGERAVARPRGRFCNLSFTT